MSVCRLSWSPYFDMTLRGSSFKIAIFCRPTPIITAKLNFSVSAVLNSYLTLTASVTGSAIALSAALFLALL